MRGVGYDGNSDSIHVGLNGDVPASAGNIAVRREGLLWSTFSTQGGASGFVMIPSAGTHTINLYMREAGSTVDQILLTTDKAFRPANSPPVPVVTVITGDDESDESADTALEGGSVTKLLIRRSYDNGPITVNGHIEGIASSQLPQPDYTVNGVDTFDPATGKFTVEFSADETQRQVSIEAISDTNTEGNEALTVVLDNQAEQAPQYLVGGEGRLDKMILDLPVVTIAADAESVDEGSSTSFTLTRTAFDRELDIIVRADLIAGTDIATIGADYTLNAGVSDFFAVHFASGIATATITVQAQVDAEIENDERVIVSLYANHSTTYPEYAIGMMGSAEMAIIDQTEDQEDENDDHDDASVSSGIDLDIDSDNDNALSNPDRTVGEEAAEDGLNQPGKLVLVNDGDSDRDGIPDFADNNAEALTQLVPVVLELKGDVDLSVATIRFEYAASDPSDDTTTEIDGQTIHIPADGYWRLWTAGGAFIPTSIDLSVSSLGFTSSLLSQIFMLESVRPTSEPTSQPTTQPEIVKAVLTNGQLVVDDQVVAKGVKVDLDINNDEKLGSFDKAADYLPGTYGGIGKISTGPFNSQSYVGQEMNIVVEGIGNGGGLDEITFKIKDSVTKYPGYAGNATDAKVEGPGKDDDYSFKALENAREATGVMAAKRTVVDFWCKDYGGFAAVEVMGKKGAKSFLITTLQIPLDKDNDTLGDYWESLQAKAWNAQYGEEKVNFDPQKDEELKDPDGAQNGDGGTNLPAHKTAGDSLSVLKEYRGYILDGGVAHDPGTGAVTHDGGYLRLSPVYKELLVETDYMKGVTMPPANDMKAVLNAASAGFSDKTNGAGLNMFWVIDQPEAGELKVFENAVTDEMQWANGVRNVMLKKEKFVHLMFASKNDFTSTVLGATSLYGSYVFVSRVESAVVNLQGPGATLKNALSWTTAHELAHLLMDAPGPLEHTAEIDVNRPYLLFPRLNDVNVTMLKFDDEHRKLLDLINKESVERA